MHCGEDIDLDTGKQRKPEIVTNYNMTKVGVDLVDQLCQKENVSHNTRRWLMVLFYNFLNAAAIHSLSSYKFHQKYDEKVEVH